MEAAVDTNMSCACLDLTQENTCICLIKKTNKHPQNKQATSQPNTKPNKQTNHIDFVIGCTDRDLYMYGDWGIIFSYT